jgi:hypothetical protein
MCVAHLTHLVFWVQEEQETILMPNAEISQNVRGLIKQHIISTMLNAPKKLRTHLSEAISAVCAVEFPEKWNILPVPYFLPPEC